MKYVKYINETQIAGFEVDIEDQKAVDRAQAKGLLPLQEEDVPEQQLLANQSVEVRYVNFGDRVVKHYVVVDNSREKLKANINRLCLELAQSDYRVVKNREYAEASLDLPYDPILLHQERETLRVQIRELETLILADE